MVTVLKEKGIFAGVNLFSKQDTMDITDMFKIPLFKNFTLKMREEFLDKLEYTVEEHPKGKTIIHQGTTCNALHVLLKGKLNVDVLDVSGNIVRVETIQAPRTFATPHIFSEKNQFPATFTVDEDVVLLKGSKESVFTLMHSMPLFLHNFLCVSTSCNIMYDDSFEGAFVSWHPEPLYLLLIRTSAKGFECRGTRTYPRAVSGVFWCYPPGFIEGNREIGG